MSGGFFQQGLQRLDMILNFVSAAFFALFVLGVIKQALFAFFSWKGGVSPQWWTHTFMLVGGAFIGTLAPQVIRFIAHGV